MRRQNWDECDLDESPALFPRLRDQRAQLESEGYTPYAEARRWRRRFWWLVAADLAAIVFAWCCRIH